jgi:hypothetical protein
MGVSVKVGVAVSLPESVGVTVGVSVTVGVPVGSAVGAGSTAAAAAVSEGLAVGADLGMLVLVGGLYAGGLPVGVTDGRMMIVNVAEGSFVAVRISTTVKVGVWVISTVGSIVADGRSNGVFEAKTGRKGVLEGGRKALRSLIDGFGSPPASDPVAIEQLSAIVAGKIQKKDRIRL